MQLLYINSEIGSVFESQVVALLKHYNQLGCFEKITLACGYRNHSDREKACNLLENSGVGIVFFKTFPNYRFFNILQQHTIQQAISQAGHKSNTIVHVRAELIAFQAAKAISRLFGTLSRTLVDVRGASREELKEFQQTSAILFPFKMWNYNAALQCLSKFGAVSTVSPALQDYIHIHTGIPSGYVNVIHCLSTHDFKWNEKVRSDFRSKLNLNESDNLLIFSSGGNAEWQNGNALLRCVSDNWKILNLSGLCIEDPRVINIFARHRDVSGYLAAADVALIFRKKSIVNYVACPVKFCEYSTAGLPVIADANVKLIHDYIQETGAGKIVADPDEINEKMILELKNRNRDRISQQAIEHFGIDWVAHAYFSIYQTLENR